MEMENHEDTEKRAVLSQDHREWSQMQEPILELFMKRLRFEEQVRFGSVCKRWHPCTPDKPYLYVPETPWLITNKSTASKFQLYRIPDKKVFNIDKPFETLAYSLIVGSLKGWLFLRARRDRLAILNLFSKLRLDLPPQRTIVPAALTWSRGYAGFGMFNPLAFSIATCSGLNPTTVAMVTSGGGLAWCKPGDKAWKSHKGEQEYGNLLLHNDKLYAVDRLAQKVYIFKFEDEGLVLVASTGSNQPPQDEDKVDPYIVGCGGRVLVLRRYYYRKSIRPTNSFYVMEVDEKCNPPRLETVHSLGGHVLFVGDSSCESLPAECCPGLHRNCVYFTGFSRNSVVHDLGEFSVPDASMIRTPLDDPILYNPVWVMPRFAFKCGCGCSSAPWITPKKDKKRKFPDAEDQDINITHLV